jgi:hypothetical protein
VPELGSGWPRTSQKSILGLKRVTMLVFALGMEQGEMLLLLVECDGGGVARKRTGADCTLGVMVCKHSSQAMVGATVCVRSCGPSFKSQGKDES